MDDIFKTAKEIAISIMAEIPPLDINKLGDFYMVYSEALRITGSGKTVKEAEDFFMMNLEDFIRHRKWDGTFDEYMVYLGWVWDDKWRFRR